MSTEKRRIEAILQIRLDGAEEWDVREFVAKNEQAGEEPWTPHPDPLTPDQIAGIIAAADRMITESCPGFPPDAARHLAMRRNLYARAIQAGEIATAARILRDIAEIEGVYPRLKTAPRTPGMAFVLIGLPAERFGEIAEEIELLACVDGISVAIEGPR